MNNTAVKRYQLIELLVPAATYGIGQKLMIGDQPELRTQDGKLVIFNYIETFSDQAVTLSPNGVPVADATQLRGGYLVLNRRGKDELYQIPMTRPNRMYAEDGANFVPYSKEPFPLLNITGIDWTKSYVWYTNAGVLAASFSYLIGVGYSIYPDDYNTQLPMPIQ